MGRAYRAVGLLVLGALAAVATRADAICGRAPNVASLPTLRHAGPSNAEVRLVLPRRWETQGFCPDIARAACAGVSMELELRRAPEGGEKPQAIAVSRVHTESGALATEVMRPTAPLAQGVYEVRAVDQTAHVEPLVLAIFKTTAEPDHLAPSWTGLLSARYVRRAAGRIPAECGEPLLVLTAAQAQDDHAAQRAIRFAIWLAAPSATIDYEKPPLLYATAADIQPVPGIAGDTLQLDLGSTEEELSNLTLDDAKSVRKIGVRAVDLAGNMSPPSEALVR